MFSTPRVQSESEEKKDVQNLVAVRFLGGSNIFESITDEEFCNNRNDNTDDSFHHLGLVRIHGVKLKGFQQTAEPLLVL